MRRLGFTFMAFFLLGKSATVIGQGQVVAISGTVRDAKTNEPVPYANIYIRSTSIGTATNAEGDFIFKVPVASGADSLMISSVGYTSRTIPIIADTHLTILLEPAIVMLNEVTVTARSGLSFLKEVLAKIPANYDTSEVQFTAFYREHYWLGDFELAFNEAVLDIHRVFNYDKKRNDQIRIIKGRKKKINFGKDPQFLYWISNVSNTARSSLLEDIVKYNKVKQTPFYPTNYKYYEYACSRTIQEHDRNIIVMDIYPKRKARKGYVKMTMYIDEASLAIVKIDLEPTPEGIQYINKHEKGFGYAIMSKVVHATFDFSAMKVSLSYKEYNGKWYLSTVQRHWEALVNSKKRNMADRVWRVDMNFIVTDIDTDNVRTFSEDEVAGRGSSIGNMIGNDYDETFWENYNVLKPVLPDSLKSTPAEKKTEHITPQSKVSNRRNGFTRADTLQGTLSPIRSCYDVGFYHLDVGIDVDKRSVRGSTLIRFKAVKPFRKMQVDLYANMKIDSILFRNQHLNYSREFNAVFITLPQEIPEGSIADITIYYEGLPKTPDWSIPMNGGILWDKDSLGNPWIQVVCQGSGASLWWPNKDHLSDEPDSMKIWITVPEDLDEISNGRLKHKTPVGNDRMRYEWSVSYPINNYDVTFNLGKYTHIRDVYVDKDTLTIDYYVLSYDADKAMELFKQVPPMLSCFQKYFGEYPFKRDGFALVESLHAMEHQSGVCIGKIPRQQAGSYNPLMWHESAHEWWGNAISCSDMADLWIHEGFATYAESLMIECEQGTDAALSYINSHRGSVKNNESILGIRGVNHIFYDIGDMYEKAMLMLNTLRWVINDNAKWFGLLRSIQQHFRYQTLTTDDLVTFINVTLKNDYTYFFDQYLRHTNLPELELEFTEKGNDLIVRYRWKADVANFRMPIAVTTSVNKFELIYPTTEWKTATLRGMSAADFEVDEQRFFVEVTEKP